MRCKEHLFMKVKHTVREFTPLAMPCGGTAEFDYSSGCAHRCTTCMSVVGSIGMPRECKEMMDMYDNWQKLGGRGWNYVLGQEYE
jgi:hypothetical protein